jgi:cold shock CspA family protein/ribosome-associated translation inhibitor RaiA
MDVAPEVSYRRFDPNPEIQELVEREIGKLERYFSRVVSCRVVVELPHRSRGSGNLYHVRIDVSVPGKELVVSRDPSRDERRRSARVAITDAFRAMRRQLEEHSQEVRGDVKAHQAPPHGRIVKLKPLEGYGFLESADGRSVYFHENAVTEGELSDLDVGEEVRFSEAEEGIEGPQASAVWPAGEHHVVERRPRKKEWK